MASTKVAKLEMASFSVFIVKRKNVLIFRIARNWQALSPFPLCLFTTTRKGKERDPGQLKDGKEFIELIRIGYFLVNQLSNAVKLVFLFFGTFS